MPFDVDLIPEAVARYHRERDRYVKLADRVAEICREDICEANAIRAQITSRVKTEKSFETKLRRFSKDEERNYDDVDVIFEKISDLAGVRISAYREEDCEVIVNKLKGVFDKPKPDSDANNPDGDNELEIDRKDKKTAENANYYRAIHVQVTLPEDQLLGTYDNVGDISCEIQICTMIAHVWNEIEHDIGYKPETSGLSPLEKFHLSQLGKLVRQGDTCISALMEAHEHQIAEQAQNQNTNAPDNRPFIDVHDFISRMRDFADRAMPQLADNSGQLFDLLTNINVNSPAAIKETLTDFDRNETITHLDNFKTYLVNKGVRDGLSIDPQTSDLMLVALLTRELDSIDKALKGRAGRGRGPPTRLHRIVAHYREWQQGEPPPITL